MKGVVITLAYFFFNLLPMAAQQTFLRAAACLPVGPKHRAIRSYPRALRARPYHGLYLIAMQNSDYTTHTTGRGSDAPFVGCPAQYLLEKTGLPFSINTVSDTKQNLKS